MKFSLIEFVNSAGMLESFMSIEHTLDPLICVVHNLHIKKFNVYGGRISSIDFVRPVIHSNPRVRPFYSP